MSSFTLVLSLCILSCGVLGNSNNKVNLPTMVWDPNNAIFTCKEPVFRIRKSDKLSVNCGMHNVHNYLRFGAPSFNQPTTQVMFVETEKEYNQCNITAGKPILRCNADSNERAAPSCVKGINCTQNVPLEFDEHYPIPVGLRAGKMYHFIGASGASNAPCIGNDTMFKEPMKFRVYVCTDEEEDEGLCEPCQTESCYHSRCQETCTEWVDSSENIFQDKEGKCFKTQKKTCTSNLVAISQTDTREERIACPQPKCEKWRQSKALLYKDGVCSKLRERECIDFRGNNTIQREMDELACPPKTCQIWSVLEKIKVTTSQGDKCSEKRQRFCSFKTEDNQEQAIVENKEFEVNCTQPTLPPPIIITTEETKPPPSPSVAAKIVYRENTDKETYIYIIIAASFGSLIVGIMLGFCITKCCQRNSKSEVIKTVEKMMPLEGVGPVVAYENKNFTLNPVMEEGQLADVEFVPATATIGNTKRQVMVARSVSFYTPEDLQQGGKIDRRNSEGNRRAYRPPRTINESSRNVMRHPSATSKTVLIRNHSDVTERTSSESDGSVFHLRQPDDCTSEEV
ncbi:uncharacterized protein [Clytia hemisphaerica]|uniref:Cnidarian restricted protein n=1 Tax=Clytia hemisphaerica TaxID=252671 RepID=A0A7M5UR52_9CNID|eukprot:TCONS_00006303-protein